MITYKRAVAIAEQLLKKGKCYRRVRDILTSEYG
jgi:hypothetical protein